MDDLDRLFIRLVENVRTLFPEYLTRPFEVAELYQTLVPYRHYRRELGIETNGDYEAALLRLLAGERGYLQVDGAMQEAMERELASANPNTALFREFAASRVALSPDAPRLADQLVKRDALGNAIGAAAAFGSGSAPAVPRPPAPEGAAARAPERAPERTAPRAPAPPNAGTAGAGTAGAGAPIPPSAARGGTPGASAPPGGAGQPTPAGGTRATGPQGVVGGACPYCSGALPNGRPVVFCPHCGQNLTIQRCPACGTELEMGWKFCITCGRGLAAGA
ncbi:MAG TPA: zinc ribbon domain-containing protein [Gemmatimonadaceae bacterium]|nr:zinc ribbon domain-containing protein [Gemmatimonadaceae bacterium]